MLTAMKEDNNPYNRREIDLQFLKDLFLQDWNWRQNPRVYFRGLWDFGL